MSKNNDEGLVLSPDDTRLSDISFPSYVSGLESFMDFEETIEGNDYVFPDANSEKDAALQPKYSMRAFLTVSSPPAASASTSNSLNSLNESSMSLMKLEAFQGGLHDSFLNSHSDDSERDKNLQKFLENAVSSEKREEKASLSDMIDLSKQKDLKKMQQYETTADFTLNQTDQKALNQTELDSLFLKEVRQRLQLTNMDTVSGSLTDELEETLKEVEHQQQPDEARKSLPDDISNELKREIHKVEEGLDRRQELYGNVQRPNLDGSSSDSDTDNRPISTGVVNFARTGIQTQRFELQQDLEDMNLDNIPERQLAEGIDNESEGYNDGGGGGDGSSGHSDDDMGGDGGVPIRNTTRRFSPAVGSENGTDEDDSRSTPPSRERPVGGSGNNDITLTRQVHFANSTPPAQGNATSNTLTPNGANNDAGSTETTPQDSRLSARYFLAASTPFKSTDITQNNWMNQTPSFQINGGTQQSFQLNGGAPQSDERTLVGGSRNELTIDTPTSMTINRLRQEHGDTPQWSFQSATGVPNVMVDQFSQQTDLNPFPANPFDNTDVDVPMQKLKKYNPFETINGDMVNYNDRDFNDSIKSEDFHNSNRDLEAMFAEDEREVAKNNNSVFKDVDETGVSEWSVRTQNQQINSIMLPSEAAIDDDNGRVSVYFKTKSNELGKLSGDGTIRPNFSDETHEVVTPPAAVPISLVQDEKSAEQDRTIPASAMSATFKVDDKEEMPETPKSALLKTHKRMSNTVLMKNKKRQLVGEEASANLSKDSKSNDTNIVSDKPPVLMPASELEASTLLDDIKERRVSTKGLNDTQVLTLAKLIAAMTGTDEELVYQLICLLPKKENVNKEVPVVPQHVNQSSNTQYNTMSNYASFVTAQSGSFNSLPSMGSVNKVTPYQGIDRIGKPISSVIPINATERTSRDVYRPRDTNINYMQSTRIPERYSDPQPLFERKTQSDRRLAVSVSPVRNNVHNTFATVVTPSYGGHPPSQTIEEMNSMQQRTAMMNSFVPLPPTQMESFIRSSDANEFCTYASSNPKNVSSFGSISSHDSLIHADSIIYPNNVLFDVCSTGTSTTKVIRMQNTNKCWMQVQLQIAFFAFNGREMDHRCNESFMLPPKVTLEPRSDEEIKLKFQPDHPGSYMLKVELLVTSLIQDETNLRWQRLPGVINIDGIGETPNLELLYTGSQFLDFGEISYGSRTQQEFKILNKGRADVPVVVHVLPYISSSSETSLFLLQPEDKNQSDLLSKLSVFVPGHKVGQPMKPKVIHVCFQAPKMPSYQVIEDCTMSPPSEHTSQLVVETATKNPLKIGNAFMKAIAGFSRLHSLKTMQTINFNAVVNQTVSRIIPLRNAGNITLKLQAKIIGPTGHFSVHPEFLSIKPGGESEVKVSFLANTSTTTEGRLFVTLQPDGHQYEWTIRGTCTNVPSPVAEKPVLLCNKLALNWSSVAIAASKQQKLVLRNSSDTKSVELFVSISDGHSSFRVHSSPSLHEKAVNRYEATIKPHGELPIYVSYSPTCLAMEKSSLILRMINGSTKFVVPLAGYGGTSNLDISGAKRTNDQFIIDMGHIVYGQKKTVHVMLRNSGLRAAFIAMKCFTDVTAKTEYPSSHVTIIPNNFVLMEKTSCQITIVYEQEHTSKGVSTPANLVIYSGDEVMRKGYQRYHRKMSCVKRQTSNTLKLLSITTDFFNETNVKEDVAFNKVSDWENFFLSNINRNIIAMVTKQPTEMEAEKLVSQRFNDDEIVPLEPNRKVKSRLSDFKATGELWRVTPQSITIDASLPSSPSENTESSSQCRLKIINYSNKELPFRCYCPSNSLVITPNVDRVPPHSQLGIRLDPKHTFLSKYGKNTWTGEIYVECRDEKRCIPVEVTNNLYFEKIDKQVSPDTNKNKLVHDYSKKIDEDVVPWDVNPKEIILDANVVSTEYKLRITNNTDTFLPFEFIWPAESLVITPSIDKVQAHESLGVRIDAKHTFLAKHDADWHGSIYIQVGDQQKRVQVRINKSKSTNQVVDNDQAKTHVKTAQMSSSKLSPPPSSHDLSLEPHQHYAPSTKEITITPQLLEFKSVLLDQSSESILTIKNPSKQICHWNVRPACPTYFKSFNEKTNVKCLSSPVFHFLNVKGIIGEDEVLKLPVTFHPEESGIYSQFWDFEITYQNGAFVKTSLELIGKGQTESQPQQHAKPITAKSSNELPSNKNAIPQKAALPKAALPKTEHIEASTRIGHVFVKDDVIEFPETKLGKTSEMKFRLCNDGNQIQRVRVSGFHAPFSVVLKHTRLSIKPKSYIRVPVYYTPTVPDSSSQGLLLLLPDTEEEGSLCVKLAGKCA